jgi:hypothetical protein
MTPLAQHISCRLRNDGPIADTLEKRCLLSRAVLEIGRELDLLSFGAVDTHLHMAKAGATGGEELGRRVEISLARTIAVGVGFERARVWPVNDIWHLYRLFEYTLKQGPHHGVGGGALLEATNLPDLLGMRLVGAYTLGIVKRLLPRVQRARLLGLAGLAELVPADGPLELIPAAAAAALCRSALDGRLPEVTAARRAAIELVGDRLTAAALAELLGVHRATLHRLREAPVDGALLSAIRLQLGARAGGWAGSRAA